MTARRSATGRYDPNGETWVAHTITGGGFDASEDGTGRGTPIVPVAGSLGSGGRTAGSATTQDAFSGLLVPIAFSSKDHGADAMTDLAPTLRAMNHSESHANASGQVAIAFDMRGREGGSQFEGPHETANIRAASGGSSRSYIAFDETQITNPTHRVNPQPDDPCFTLHQGRAPTLAFNARQDPINGSVTPPLDMNDRTVGIFSNWRVRRLTPLECERLQGFPDGYTAVPYRGKLAADGPRYRALGNSFAVNVVRWIGKRIQMVEDVDA